MTDYFSDTFTDTDETELASHTPEVGTSWALGTYSSSPLLVRSNRLTNPSFSGNMHHTGDGAPTADYSVSATVVVLNSRPFGVVRIGARWQSGSDDYYFGEFDDGNQEWHLGKRIGFSDTILDTSTASLAAVGTNRLMTLTVTGDALELLVDSVSVCTATDATITTGGQGAVLVGGLVEEELCLDNYTISDAGSSDPLVHDATGSGFFTVASPLWLKTEITGGSAASVGNANPPNYYHLGQLTWCTDNGCMKAYPITRTLDLVQLPADMTTVYYAMGEGITATITELSAP